VHASLTMKTSSHLVLKKVSLLLSSFSLSHVETKIYNYEEIVPYHI
jgi:hypothetical protein